MESVSETDARGVRSLVLNDSADPVSSENVHVCRGGGEVLVSRQMVIFGRELRGTEMRGMGE